MDAQEALRGGRLEEALSALEQQVRREPAEARHRVFLAQLLCVLGQWQRALGQVQVAGELDAGNLGFSNTYREVVRCELLRAEVFAGRRAPLVLGEPEPWLALLLEALRLAALGEWQHSQELRGKAFEAAPASPGTLDGQPFEWIADADPRLGPVLEAIVAGRYYWVPFSRVLSVSLEAPQDLRDLVWLPAGFRWRNGGEAVGFVPSRYPGSEASQDGTIRLARRTEWVDRGAGLYTGVGQRLLVTDVGEHALFDTRHLVLADGETVAGRAQGRDGG